MAELAIRVDAVTKTFKSLKAVDRLSFEVETARCFGLIGSNGAGKTTMMNMIYGKTRRDQSNGGQINVLGYDPEKNVLEIKYLSGIVPQENNLDIELSVLQNLIIYARFYGLKKKEAMPRIGYLLEFMELTDKKEARIRDLSGGMQRRLVIARALINSPELLILDEPTTGLDPQVRQLIWEKLRALRQEGVTIVLCTHYMEEAFQICDSLMIMHRGIKVMDGNPASLVRTHMEPWVLEVYNPGHLIGKKIGQTVRIEKTPSRAMLFSRNVDDLKAVRDALPAGDYFLRQSNLEDLFLKATGRSVNE
ncbi:MAG: ABC transporter ATP-binding protein [Pseudomonadota bacterium]